MKRIIKISIVLILLAIVGTAGLLGARVFISFDDFGHSLKKFSQILSIIEERYPDEDMDTQPYVAMELANKVIRDIADKYNMDEELVGMIIRDYTEMIRDSLEREMPEEQ